MGTLTDLLQGASNAAASNVSGPIDAAAWVLRKLGVPIPNDPLLGSEWMAAHGLIAQPQNRYAGMAGETLGLVAPIAAAAYAPQIARGLLAGEDAAKQGAMAVGQKAADTAESYMAQTGLLQQATAEARAAEVTRVKRRVGTTGQYVGAPEGIDSPQKLAALVHKYKNTMELGMPGREFYRESSADILNRTGGNTQEADIVAQNLAQLSRANNVAGNTSMSVKGHIQGVTGEPVNTGRFPSKDSPPLEQLYKTGLVEYQGHKRDPFATQLGVKWAPERIGRGVNDMHEAEIMGYPSGKPGGPTQHAFMDEVRQRAIDIANKEKLGGFSDWDTGTAQAAAWTGNKIRRGEVLPGDAAKTYAYFFPRTEASATYEQVSSPVVGHLQGLLNAPYEQRMMYTLDPRGSWTTSGTGRDIGYTAARALPGETQTAIGRFGDTANPAFIARPTTAVQTNAASQSRELTQGSKSLLDLVEGSRAYFDAQEAGAWHKLLPAKNAADYSGASITFGKPFTKSDMEAVAPLFESKGYYLASHPQGVTVIANESTKSGAAMAKEIKDIVRANKSLFGASTVDLGRLESGFINYGDAWSQGKGAVTNKLLELVDKAPTTAGLLDASAPYRQAVVARTPRDLEYAAKGLGVAREDVLRARDIFARDGWEGLRRAARAGIVPAVLISPAAGVLLGGGADNAAD